ncbi:MAG: helix-turn-helix domain-containing protein [Chitinophagaceae bacterium]
MLSNYSQWYLIDSDKNYQQAMNKYEEIKYARKGSREHKEKMLLAKLISEYEEKKWSLPGVDPIQIIKIRMEEFGYKPADLAKLYGDKGTISKILKYQQPLSLKMIRLFSTALRIPAESLIEEYPVGSNSR